MKKKDIQILKKQLLMEELHRQGKAPKRKRWLLFAVGGLLFVATAVFWYRANLPAILEGRFQDGLALKEAGQYEQSSQVFQELAGEYPQFQRTPEALFELAEIFDIYQARYRDALLTYLLLVRDYPDSGYSAGAQRQIAELYKYRLDDCGQAIASYQEVLELVDDDGDRFQYEVADCYFRLNNFSQARIEFEGLQKNFPESHLLAEVQFRIAVTYALEGLVPEAEASYRLVVEKWPESSYAAEANFGLAAVLEEQERLQEALTILEALDGVYQNKVALERKIEQVRMRIEKKKKAI